MMIRVLLSFLLLLSLARTQGRELIFSHIGNRGEQLQDAINTLYQDESGLIWFGSNSGLMMWDGTKIKSFKAIIGDSTSLVTNNVRLICGDKDGHLYIVNSSALLEYDLRKERFRRLFNGGVSQINYGASGLWVLRDNTLLIYNTQTSRFDIHLRFKGKFIGGALLEASNGSLFVGLRHGGMYVVDKNKKLTHYLQSEDVYAIYEDNHKNIWVCTTSSGLYRIDQQMNFTYFRHDPTNTNSMPNDNVRAIRQDNIGNYWIGTAHGLVHYKPQSQSFTTYTHCEFDRYSLSGSSIWALEIDAQGSLWIGSFYGGVDCIHPEYSFCDYYTVRSDGNGISGSTVSQVCEDDQKNLWIGTEDGGLNFFNRKTETFTHYHNPYTPLAINIKTLLYDKVRQVLWVGTYGGFYRFDIDKRAFTPIEFTDNPTAATFIRSVHPYKDKILIGSRNMIHLYDPQNNTSVNFLDLSGPKGRTYTVWDMLVDKNQRVWVTNHHGLLCIDGKEERQALKRGYDSKSKLHIFRLTALTEDSQARIWVGSAGGVICIDPESGDVRGYNCENSNLPDNDVMALSESPSGYMLLGSTTGISVLDPQTHHISNYKFNTFFPFSRINERGITTTESGNMIISSFNGMYIMHESDLNRKAQNFNVVFTRLYANNTPVIVGDETKILSQSLPYSDHITLRNNHSVISVEYALTNYISSLRPKVEYQLEGFDPHWVQIERGSPITFTNLSPGKYTLRVRATTEDDKPLVCQRQLILKVLPPIWRTTIAYLLYFIIASILLLVILYNYTSRIKLQTSLLFSQKEKQSIEAMNKSKLEFFTHISHELRTPITLIATQLDMTIQSGNIPQNIYRRLLGVIKNVEKVKLLMSELMDFYKQEHGFMPPKVNEYDLIPFLEQIYISFKEYAQVRQVALNYIHKPVHVMVWFDKRQMEKVFNNLIFNALKFTNPGGNVTILVEQSQSKVSISIADTGIGISHEDLPKIFSQFFQSESGKIAGGTGIGLALSRNIVMAHHGQISVDSHISKGSTFKVELLLGDKHFNEEQKAGVNTEPDECITNIVLPDNEFIEEIRSTQHQSDSHTISILIVEDNIELLAVLEEIFSSIYKVYKATDGQQGYNMALKLQPDLVLSDVMMPVMSGSQLCRLIKSNDDTCHIPVVLLTARTSVDKMLEGLMIGADDYITKPFNTKILVTRCHNLINGRRQLQKSYCTGEVQSHQLTTNPYDQQLLEKAVEIIEHNITNPDFDINVFAREMCMGRTKLFTKIRGITGQTPNNLITSIKMKYARKLLIESREANIEEVAMNAGYSDCNYFIRQFKKIYGQTPWQYRKSHIGMGI
ncbi:hybrid sensor histidine kinase/response regulator transcription factor [Gallalistipes aquisgranensis]|uniref:hybrid sensor histidine kinase/response regulator transcription factor n=1 Tax=Gallalistipes aquisgranensis TaxID=2779358 RepID=UPI001CF815BE|nr:hybrid sensor histidine kinase/response regulator transcription factor [Gallalistipes aquisgranensis]MBE5032788.1 response regulator [Gallalistipes aquisgranensis]